MVQRDGSKQDTSSSASAQEEALLTEFRYILKNRLFRGYYEERRYVDELQEYRDVVSLQRSEGDLKKLLLAFKEKLSYYCQQKTAEGWIGITHGPRVGNVTQPDALDTCIWTQLDSLAFSQYWFVIRSLRLREQEIIIKLKMVRPVEASDTPERTTSSQPSTSAPEPEPATGAQVPPQPQIGFEDFIALLNQWGAEIKQSIYHFMSNDISRENIAGVLKFLGLLVLSLLSGALVATKFLGVFTLRFMQEFSRLVQVLTPIVLKIIDVFNNIVGGFYILLAMIWRDTISKPPPPPKNIYPAIENPRLDSSYYPRRVYGRRSLQQ